MTSIPRKTMNIDEIVKKFNNFIGNESISQESKKELCILLEDILQSANNYNGYNNICWINGGWVAWVNDGKPEDKKPYMKNEWSRIYY